jgi:spore coat polysaccharide biosynthesis protein SpsF (cytidylyltransferase family)
VSGGVLCVVGARLNSSRLPRKHLLDLAGRPLIDRLFNRLDRIPGIDRLVLATTEDDYNRPLLDWAAAAGREAYAHTGDVNDLVGRVDAVVRRVDPAVVLYMCGDSPLIEPDTVAALLRAVLDNADADLVDLEPCALGKFIHEGFSVYPRRTWDRIVAASTTPELREHVGSALKSCAAELRCIEVPEDPVYAGVRQRISVDTPSDYAFMAEVYRRWYGAHADDSIVSLRWLIAELRRYPELAAHNAKVRQKQVGEHSAPILLVCQVGPSIGLGHLTRTLRIARALQDGQAAGVRLLIQGEVPQRADLDLLPHHCVAADANLADAVRSEVAAQGSLAVVFDVQGRQAPTNLPELLREFGLAGIRRVGIDSALYWGSDLDQVVVPAILVSPEARAACAVPLEYGWDWLLLPTLPAPVWRPGGDVLVLIGGSDVTGLGQTLPALLEHHLPPGTRVRWVLGPYAAAPEIPPEPLLDWRVLSLSGGLEPVIRQAGYALAVFGVSCFELLAAGVPTVVFSPYPGGNREELAALAAADAAWVADGAAAAAVRLGKLLAADTVAAAMAQRSAALVDGQGAARLAQRIATLLEGHA